MAEFRGVIPADTLRGWGSGGILRAALEHALECYDGPADDTVPVLRAWLDRTQDPS